MRFPITREQLQDIKKDVEEEIIEYNINSIVESVQYRIIGRAYSCCTYHYGMPAVAVDVSVSLSNYNDQYNPTTKLKIDIHNSRFEIPTKWRLYINHTSLAASNPWRTHFERIKGKLMELFPGVSFETDPLKTYMLVDWS